MTGRLVTRTAAAGLAGLVVAGSLLVGCGATPPHVTEGCARGDLGGRSVARVWDDQTLDLIRQVVPAPTVHARNLFHMSVALWDAWAAYDQGADGYLVTEKRSGGDASSVAAARETAMSYAAYRILLWRFGTVADLATAREQLDATMASLCYRTDFAATEGDSPAALGNRIGAAVLAYGQSDGALEDVRYKDPAYSPVNDPLEVAKPGAVMRDPNRWQPLALDKQISQNGLPIPGTIQSFIGPHWGHVTPFALPTSPTGVPIDPGPPPRLGEATDQAFKDAAVDIIRRSSELDAQTTSRSTWARAPSVATPSAPTMASGTPSTPPRASRTRPTRCRARTSPACSPSTGPTGRSPRPRPDIGT